MNSSHTALVHGLEKGRGAEVKSKKRSRFIIIGTILVLVILIAAGVGVGVTLSAKKNNEKDAASSSSSTTKTSAPGPAATGNATRTGTDTVDRSVFEKDPRLHQSLWGVAYTPEGSLPDHGCAIRLDDVIRDIQLISQLTRRIRLYGSECDQLTTILEAIKQTKVNLEVWVGNYVVVGDNTAYERQKEIIKKAIEQYGVANIAGIVVGNEYMLRYMRVNNSTSPNDAIANVGAQILVDNIRDTKQMLASMNLGKTIYVANSDAGHFFNDMVMREIDYGLSNVHGWFSTLPVAESVDWTFDQFHEFNVQPASQLENKPVMVIAETGWPTGSTDAARGTRGRAVASLENLQIFIDEFVCRANRAGDPYFFFEFMDGLWKEKRSGGIEGRWGLFTSDRKLKNITLPDCAPP